MANPSHHSLFGFNPDPSLTGYLPRYNRNSPYAPGAPGSGPDAMPPSHAPINRLSYLLNPPYESPTDLYSTNPSSTSHGHYTDAGMTSGGFDGSASTSQSRTPQLPQHSRAFEMYMSAGSMDSGRDAGAFNNNAFFIPSYLKGSNYMQRLEAAHKAQQAQRARQLQPGGSLSTGNTMTGSTANKAPTSHLGMAYDIIERAPDVEDISSVAPLPTKWNKDDKHGSLEVLANGQEVKYAASRSSREQDHETCAIRADHPMPRQAGIYYFEVTLLSRRRDETSVCIGFSGRGVPLTRPPGWEPDSWGYHGDDGDIYSGHNVGKAFDGRTFGPPDIIGCGINFRTREAFFTKNGQDYKTAFRDVKGKLYPTVGMKKAGEHIRVNFGQEPFAFEIDKLVKNEQAKIKAAISKTSVEGLVSPRMGETELIQRLVLQFLQHDGYVDTARAFAQEIHAEKQDLLIDQRTPVPGVNIKDDEDARRRQLIRGAILEGDIEKAFKFIHAYYPHVLDRNPDVYFKLRCRTFIEMVRKSAECCSPNAKKSNGHDVDDTPNKMDVDEYGTSDSMEEDGLGTTQPSQEDLLARTIQYGQELQKEFKEHESRDVNKALSEVFSLLAYPNPLQVKEVAPLLDRKGRVAVAEELNSAILSSLGKSSQSALENLYAQTSVLLDYLREDGGPGSLLTIQSIVDEVPKEQSP